ncbi:MAG: helix-turn-helix domain-containing protein [Alphaproteobacteria bacterium]|nr:helix-turn-helix domain-containing protein [Alphaproteobacteria bacterium]
MKEKRLTPEELSELWNVPLATLSQWRWNGRGPEFIKLGKHILYRLQEVEVFEKEKLRKNTTRKG